MSVQATADLLWVVNSPSFVTGEEVARYRRIGSSQIDEEHLSRFLADRPARRVGRYFENLLHFWLRYVRGVEVVEHGLQIRDGNRTVGELDFLYRDERNVLTHCEASVKFFLHYPRDGASDFPGPNAADDFDRKMQKLFEHQLPLSATHRHDVEAREAFVKGMVFEHASETSTIEPAPRMAGDCLRGRWLRIGELDETFDRSGVTGAIVAKPLWLAPVVDADLWPMSELRGRIGAHFDRTGNPVMVSVRDSLGAETDRWFVVGDHWPARHP